MNDVEIAGWLGAILVLVAYYFNTIEILKTKSLSYQLINVIGAALLIYYTYHRGAFASMAVNLIWTFIGLGSLTKMLKRPVVGQNIKGEELSSISYTKENV